MYELCKELESKLITMQIPAFVRTQTDTKLHVPEILYLTHSYADEPFGLGRFATGTHSQRPLRGLCSFVLGRCAASLVSCIIILGASRLDSSSATCMVLNYIQ